MPVSNADFLGWYAVSFDGHTFAGSSWVPISAVGLIHADGIGGVQLWRTVFHPVAGVLKQSGQGTYNTKGGIRSASIVIGAETQNFVFVLNESNDELQFISTGDPNAIPINVIRGSGTRTVPPTMIKGLPF
jgi:hypothetical protein